MTNKLGSSNDDCAGECGGDAVEDNCGTCDSDTSNDCIQDCTGNYCIEGADGCLIGAGVREDDGNKIIFNIEKK